MALQCDVIPHHPGRPNDVGNVEDSVALADEDLRAELRERHSDLWQRVVARQRLMTETLGLDLAEDVLPFPDRQAHLAPALLTPGYILTLAA